MPMSSIISIKNLSFDYGATDVLTGVSFDVERGDYVALAGPNGAGKTTLIKIMLGLTGNYKGSVEMFGQEARNFNKWGKIGYLPQRVSNFNPLFPATVGEVVELGLLSKKKYPKRFNKQDRDKVIETIELMDIADLRKKLVGELSGGQQQRVFLARALVSEPELLFMDEPVTALDPYSKEHFFETMDMLNKKKGTTIILITHDATKVGLYANKFLYLDIKLIFYGGFDEFCKSETMSEYFGKFSQHLICHRHD
jgi:zinc transport system ATP-binding protein